MSYISFYRKWRPQAFSEVIGQEHIVKTLQNAISKDRLVHGYMFCGPKGTGKTSIARIFAKAINCINGPAVEPCNKCDNCISITAGSNVDIVEIDGASNRGIDNIRDLREKIKFLPVFLWKKIYIIDEAHQITGPAFNALLKTLEEPPEHVIFMMATTDPHAVIQTIMSRCQRFDFRPISLEGLRLKLKDIASSEDIDITDSALSIVAKYSDGSLRDAEGILEQLASFNSGRITVDDVSSILGIIDQDMIFELANIILEKNINQGLLFVSRLFSTSFSLNAFISEFLEHLYNLYVIKNYENPADILDMPDDFKENYFNQAGLFNSWQLERLIELFTALLAQIKESENSKTFFKAAVIKALSVNTEEIKVSRAMQSVQTIQSLKDKTQDIGQSKIPSVELKAEQKDTKEVTIIKTANIDSFNAAGNVTGTEVPGQEKMAEAKNAPDRDTTGTTGKQEPDNTADKKAGEIMPDKNSSDDKSSILENPVEELPEGMPQYSKKITGDFSRIIPEIWETVQVKIKAKSVPLQAILKEVKRFYIRGNKIIFSLEPKNHFHKDELNKLQNREQIQELLKSLTGEIFEVIFDFISDNNISESIDLVHPGRKIGAAGNLPEKHKETPGSGLEENKDLDETGSVSGNVSTDVYGYFEETFKVKEK